MSQTSIHLKFQPNYRVIKNDKSGRSRRKKKKLMEKCEGDKKKKYEKTREKEKFEE